VNLFGTGWLRGLNPTRDLVHASEAHMAAAAERIGSRPDEGGLTLEPLHIDQNPHGESCTAELGIGLIHGLTGIACSSEVPWWAARLHDAPGAPLRNVGVSFAGFLSSVQRHGACPIANYDPGPYGYKDEPPALARAAAQAFNLDVVPLWGTGDEVVTGMVDALSQGLPGGIALRADDVYQAPIIDGGEAYVGPELGEGGLHAVRIWRYRRVADGFEFMSPGSWGDSWGVSGASWLHQSRVSGAYFACFARGAS
jgi:hypothetical protein